MILRPEIKPSYRVEVVSQEGIFLLSENKKHVVEGLNLCTVFLAIDGLKTSQEIVQSLQHSIAPQDILASLDLLEKQGHIIESNRMIPKEVAAFWTELTIDMGKLPSMLSSFIVQVIGTDEINTDSAVKALQSLGVNVAASGNVLLVFSNNYLSPELAKINDYCLANKIPWMLVKPGGINIWVGPIFVPGRSLCWDCLQKGLRNNTEVENYLERKNGYKSPVGPPSTMVIPIAQIAVNMGVIQLIRWLTAGVTDLENYMLVLDTLTLNFSQHTVVRRPQCPKCGNPEIAKIGGKPLMFQSRISDLVKDGGYRVESPDITFNKFSKHISPVTGIVKSIYPSVWNHQGPLKVYIAGQNLAIQNENLFVLKNTLRALSGGKGRTDSQARTSALCESLERFSGVFKNEEEVIFRSYNEMKEIALNPNWCTLYSEQQYLDRDKWNKRGQFQWVPLPLDKNAQIGWSPVYSYSQKKVKYLPTSYLYYNFPDTLEKRFAWADSNGNAAGGCIEDACLQGILEIVERDSVAIWWYNMVKRPEFRLETLKDPYIDVLIDYYKQFKRKFWVLDLTTDTGIPAFVAISRKTVGPSQDIIFGFGAHLDVRIAVNRAVTELNQFLPHVLSTSPEAESFYNFGDAETINWWKTSTLENQDFLVPIPGQSKGADDYENLTSTDILEHLNSCISKLETLGHEVLVLNQTRPDIGLDVVKMIVPGMRHFWARYAPGRLYDVPVKLGWLDKKKKESELNPFPMFL